MQMSSKMCTPLEYYKKILSLQYSTIVTSVFHDHHVAICKLSNFGIYKEVKSGGKTADKCDLSCEIKGGS